MAMATAQALSGGVSAESSHAFDPQAMQAQTKELRRLVDQNSTALEAALQAARPKTDMYMVLDDVMCQGAACGSPWGASQLLPGTLVQEGAVSGGFSLWLGSVDDALDLDALRKHGITAIVNMARSACEEERGRMCALLSRHAEVGCPHWESVSFDSAWYAERLECEDFQYLSIDAQDHPRYPIFSTFSEVRRFLQDCRTARRGVLVHCMQGVNRSAVVCAAFLACEGLTDEVQRVGIHAGVDWVSQRRTPVLQNTGFLRALLLHFGAEVPVQGGASGADDHHEVGQVIQADLSGSAGTSAPTAPFQLYEVGGVVERSPQKGMTDAQESSSVQKLERPISKFKAARASP